MGEEIKKLNERVKELEDDLANRPEPKDDSSDSYSDKDEKEDNSAEIEEWKSKYEKISQTHEQVTKDFDRYKRSTQSEIEELNISNQNLEKRNIELKLQLRRNNIEAPDSPDKVQRDSTMIEKRVFINEEISMEETV